MKKILIINVILVGLFLFTDNAFSENIDYDFRNATWGMTFQEVHKSEQLVPISVKKDIMVYKDVIYDNDAFVVYEFNSSDKLNRGIIIFYKKNIKNKNVLLDRIRYDLNKKYGDFFTEEGISQDEKKFMTEMNKLMGLFFYKNDKTEVSIIDEKNLDYLAICYEPLRLKYKTTK